MKFSELEGLNSVNLKMNFWFCASWPRYSLLVVALAVAPGLGGSVRPPPVNASSVVPDATLDGIPAVMEWSEQRVHLAERRFLDRNAHRLPSPAHWSSEIVYQIVVDRFNDGDPTNNSINLPAHQAEGDQGSFRHISEYRHGGDLRGVIQRLDYLVDLGISTIWLTPILMNGDGDYHGYCVSDFTKIDPGFGHPEDLVELVKRAHQRGIRVILDIVVNHVCDRQTKYASFHSPIGHSSCAFDLERAYQIGAPLYSERQIALDFSDKFFRPLRSQRFFHRCGPNTVQDMEANRPASRFGDFLYPMLDLNTSDTDLQTILVNLMKYWIAEADVDGFRLDAAKHISPSFTGYFSSMIRDYAASLGKDNFFIVAEVAADSVTITRHLGKMSRSNSDRSWRLRLGSVVNPNTSDTLADVVSRHVRFPLTGSNAVYDFAHSGIARDVLTNKRPSGALEHYFLADSYYRHLSDQTDSSLNFTVLEIHDWPRLNESTPDDQRISQFGLSYLATAPGIPVIYYGMEQGFNGLCRSGSISSLVTPNVLDQECSKKSESWVHSLFRQDMFVGGMFRLGSSIPSVNSLAFIGPPPNPIPTPGGPDPYLRRDHQIYLTSRRLNYLRRSCVALQRGDISWVKTESKNPGLFAFSRKYQDQEILILANNSDREVQVAELPVKFASRTLSHVEDSTIQARQVSPGYFSFGGFRL
ncbi:MAG: hypothetical protein KGQ59_07425, partial [Bdellovibrionales bacterium]|nr:hypothetical protein [Bdellovibrionales bacterium]